MIDGFIRAGGEDDLVNAFELCRTLEVEGASSVIGERGIIYDQDNFALAHALNKKIRTKANGAIKDYGESMLDLYYKTHLFDAPFEFDSFCLYIEKGRDPKKRFYLPRRKQLLPCVEALQDLEYGKIELLAISEPPGVGKTTLAEFFLAWTVGRNPFLPNLIGSHNNSFLAGMYGEMTRILERGGEYCWGDVFPGLEIISTNAKDLMIGVGYTKRDDMRFKTLEFTSIGAGNAGKVRAMNILYCDDLVSDITQALSKERLDKLWQQYYTDLRQRKIGTRTKELHIATRWSVHDVVGRLEREYGNDPKARFIRFPALNEDDESNFDYPYGLGYTTKDLHDQREIMDDASFRALYMNEPIEREGTLFSPEELQYFTDLPEAEPDAIIAVCDTKEQGSDYCAMPVFYQYGDMFYVNSFICDNGKVEIVQERVAERLVDEKVKQCQIESNRGGTLFANTVKDRVKELGGFTSITTKWTQTNKQTRIQVNSAYAKSHFLFRDPSAPETPKEYRTAMNQLCTYSMIGKVKNDDVADVLALSVDYVLNHRGATVQIIKRPF
jgi:predicted phage terminase large subunit-like protein